MPDVTPRLQLGQYGAPAHTIAHISDSHFLGGRQALYGKVDTDRTVATALEQLATAGVDPEAIVITGDLADLGEPDAYRRLREAFDPAAERLGARMIWVMGNHDEREPFAQHLLDEEPTLEPLDRVHWLGGLRIIALDSTVPGYHHGELTAAQLDWLRAELATPAPDGTLLALHHPPLPVFVELMAVIELRDQHRLAAAIAGTDVRGILGGHLHYSTHGTFAGVPVSVAAATCYTIDASSEPYSLRGVDAGQAFNIVQLYPETVTHTIVPITDAPPVSGFGRELVLRFASLSPEQRLEAFSSKHPAPEILALLN